LLLLGRLIIGTGRRVGTQAGKSWHLALANLKRRASENSIQLVSFTIAIQLLLLIVVVKSSIIADWQNQFPENTPNYYVLNVNESQLTGMETFIEDNNIASEGFYQMVRGRLTKVNGEVLQPRLTEKAIEEQAKQVEKGEKGEETERRRGVGRELGLTWSKTLPYQNELVKGDWWEKGDETAQVSIEKSLAKRLNIKLNDELSFDIGGQKLSAVVTNIRTVNWQNRQLNFYIIFNQEALKGFSSTYIAAWMLPEEAKDNLTAFAKQFPTVSLMDFGAILEQLFQVIDQVSIALQFILVLVVLGGSLVLVAQVQSSMEERERELAILRTLGAKGSLLRNSVLFEFVALGAIAGLMASFAMEFAVFLLQRELFDMPTSFHFSYWFLGISSGAIFVGLMGLLSCWHLLRMSSVDLIRRTF
jgi:putative ABC transport system permease protein